MTEYSTRNVYIAFALVLGAGSATALGASIVLFLPKVLSQHHHTLMNRYVLASSLGISAGVMIYVSMIEIFQKSRIAFIDVGYEENIAYIYATICFFAGIIIMMLLNTGVTYFLHSHHHHPHQSPELQQHVQQTHQRRHPATNHNNNNATSATNTTSGTTNQQQQQPTTTTPTVCCSSDDPVRDLEILQQMASIIVAEHEQRDRLQQEQEQQQPQKANSGNTDKPDTPRNAMTPPQQLPNDDDHISSCNNHNNNIDTENHNDNNHDDANIEIRSEHTDGDNTNAVVMEEEEGVAGIGNSRGSSSTSGSSDENNNDTTDVDNERKTLLHMSMNTAIAIGLHNFPEGLATFVATLHDPSVGAVLAIAIAIHNIPEGLCVALPIYYATGNRRTAFGWAILSGLSEPVAAVFGYIILANTVNGTTYGILFGIVAGMMVMISTRELLPTAHRYDPTDRVVTYSFIFGMSILALSLVLFVL